VEIDKGHPGWGRENRSVYTSVKKKILPEETKALMIFYMKTETY